MARHRLASQFDAAAAAGRICLVAWRQRQAVGYAWFADTADSHDDTYGHGLTITIGSLIPSPAGGAPSANPPAPDDQEVAAALIRAGLWLARTRGFRRSWMIAHPDDVATLCTVADVAPSSVLGTVGRVKVLAWMRSWYRGLSAPVPIRIPLSR